MAISDSLFGGDDLAGFPFVEREALRGQVAGFAVGDLADSGRDFLAVFQRGRDGFRILCASGLLDAGFQHFDGGVGVEREGLGRDVLGSERIGGSFGIRVLGGVGGIGEQRACRRIRADRPELGVGEAIAADDRRVGGEVMQLAGEQAAFRVICLLYTSDAADE